MESCLGDRCEKGGWGLAEELCRVVVRESLDVCGFFGEKWKMEMGWVGKVCDLKDYGSRLREVWLWAA